MNCFKIRHCKTQKQQKKLEKFKLEMWINRVLMLITGGVTVDNFVDNLWITNKSINKKKLLTSYQHYGVDNYHT